MYNKSKAIFLYTAVFSYLLWKIHVPFCTVYYSDSWNLALMREPTCQWVWSNRLRQVWVEVLSSCWYLLPLLKNVCISKSVVFLCISNVNTFVNKAAKRTYFFTCETRKILHTRNALGHDLGHLATARDHSHAELIHDQNLPLSFHWTYHII